MSYTRKSHEESLDQEFNSLDAQRQASEAYVESQRHEGWQCLDKRYDDGGFSGGTMERPALDELLSDICAGRIVHVNCWNPRLYTSEPMLMTLSRRIGLPRY